MPGVGLRTGMGSGVGDVSGKRRPSTARAYTATDVAALSPFAWWKAGDLALAHGAAVASWADASGNGHTITQAVGAKKPTMDTAGINNLAAVRFTEANVSSLKCAVSSFGTCTIFAAVRTPTSSPTTDQYLTGVTGSGGCRRDIFYTSASVYGLISSGGNFTATTVEPPNTTSIVVGVFNTSSSLMRVDAIPTASTLPAMTGSATTLAVGARGTELASFDGWIGEVIYFSSATLTAAQIAGVEQYLSTKWGIARSQTGIAYVNQATGSDTLNTGRAVGSPFATLAAAKTYLAGAGTIYATSTQAAPFRELLEHDGSGTLSVESTTGDDVYVFGSTKVTSGWAALGGGVYSQTLTLGTTTPALVMVTTLTDTIGGQDLWLRLTENTSTPTTPAAGEFGVSGSVVYVHLPGDVSANFHTIEVPVRNNCLTSRGSGRLVVRDVQHWCGVIGGLRVGVSGSPLASIVASGGGGRYCGTTGGFATAGTYAESSVSDFVSWANANDGFNVHGNTGESSLVTITDCDGSYNDDEGASNHDDTTMRLVGGTFSYNGSGGMTAVNNARTDIVGGEFHHNQRTTLTVGEGAVCWRDATNTGSLDGDADIHDNYGPGIVRNPSAVVNYGSSTSADNGQADQL